MVFETRQTEEEVVWTGLEFGKSQWVVENREKWKKKPGCKIICDAPTTFAVKGLMMMMDDDDDGVRDGRVTEDWRVTMNMFDGVRAISF